MEHAALAACLPGKQRAEEATRTQVSLDFQRAGWTVIRLPGVWRELARSGLKYDGI